MWCLCADEYTSAGSRNCRGGKKVTFNDTQNITERKTVSAPIRSAASVRPKGRVTELAGGILKVSLGISDMAWRVSASRSDGSQSGLSDLIWHLTPRFVYGIDCDAAWQESTPGDGIQQVAVGMEYSPPGMMAFTKLLAACGVDDLAAHVCVCGCVCVHMCEEKYVVKVSGKRARGKSILFFYIFFFLKRKYATTALPLCRHVQNCWPANGKCFAPKLLYSAECRRGHFNRGSYVYAVYKVLRKTLHFKYSKTVPTQMKRMQDFRIFIWVRFMFGILLQAGSSGDLFALLACLLF